MDKTLLLQLVLSLATACAGQKGAQFCQIQWRIDMGAIHLKRLNQAIKPVSVKRLCVIGMLAILTGCGINQEHSTTDVDAISLEPGQLERYGIAFISPATVTGQEQDRQTVAFAFTKQLEKMRPEIKVVSLPETLSAINEAGLYDRYKRMFIDYRETGIFRKDILTDLGFATSSRYIAQLKLADFRQDSSGRFGALGLKIVNTKSARIRLFLQIWDSNNGTVAWEGIEELSMASETSKEKNITFANVVETAAKNLIRKLPQGEG
jgi:hypothetical protein